MEEDGEGYLKPKQAEEDMYDVADGNENDGTDDYDLTPETNILNVSNESKEEGNGDYDLASNQEDGNDDYDLASNQEDNNGDYDLANEVDQDIDNKTEVGSECSDTDDIENTAHDNLQTGFDI